MKKLFLFLFVACSFLANSQIRSTVTIAGAEIQKDTVFGTISGYMAVTDSAYNVTMTGGWDWVTSATNTLWTQENASPGILVRGDSIVIKETGLYHIGYSVSYAASAASAGSFLFAIDVNGTPEVGGMMERGMSATTVGAGATQWEGSLTAGDVVKIVCKRQTGTNDIVVHQATVHINK